MMMMEKQKVSETWTEKFPWMEEHFKIIRYYIYWSLIPCTLRRKGSI